MFLEFSTAYYSATAYKALTEKCWLSCVHWPTAMEDGWCEFITYSGAFVFVRLQSFDKNETGEMEGSSLTAVCRAFLNVLNEDASQHTLF